MNDASNPFPVLRYHRGLHWLAMFLAAWNLLIIVAGGTVKSHEAGLSIPEPFIYTFIKDWDEGNRLYEFVHRALIPLLTAGILAIVIWIHISETRRSVKRFSLLLIVSVLLQAFVGYLTVDRGAHPSTSIPHAALGQSLFAMLAGLATVLSPRWMSSDPGIGEKESPSIRRLALYTLIAVFVQLLLGGALRHDDHAKALRAGRDAVFFWHVAAHVAGAFAVGYFLSRLLFRVFRDHRDEPGIRGLARWMMMLFALQLVLGTLAAVLKFQYVDSFNAIYHADNPPPVRVWTATPHVVTGAVILALSTVLTVRTYRYVVPRAVTRASAAPIRPESLNAEASA